MTRVDDLEGTDPRMTTAAARLLAQSVPDEAAGLVPYALDSCHRYLAAVLAPPPSRRTVAVRTILRDRTPVAVADWRMHGTTLFLNGLSVSAAFRGGGLGRQLVDDGVTLARALGLAHLGLDVAPGNDAANALYRRCGFTSSSESAWHHVPVDDEPEAGTGRSRILDWPMFAAAYAAYGFGDLSIRDSDGRVASVRAVGDSIRLDGDADIGLPPAELAAIIGCTRGYAVGGSAERPFLRFIRMTRPAAATTGRRRGTPRG